MLDDYVIIGIRVINLTVNLEGEVLIFLDKLIDLSFTLAVIASTPFHSNIKLLRVCFITNTNNSDVFRIF